MRKGYNYLFISFAATVVSSFFSKIGATTLDNILFILVAYSIGSVFILNSYMPKRKKLSKRSKTISVRYGIIVGIINFFAFITLMTALSMGPGSLIIPILGTSIAIIAVFSMIIFKERLNKKGILGFLLALVAIALLA
jgi:transporter family protein